MNKPKIVLFDLETMSDLEQIFKRIPSIGAWPGRTLKGDMMSIVNFGYKYLGEKETHCIANWELASDINDDAALVHMAYEILKDADGIVTHNGKQFDIKVLNTRLAKYGLPPVPKMPHADTKVIAKRGLSLYSNSLNEVASFFNLEQKMENGGWNLWVQVHKGNKQAQKLMVEYCKQDVNVLEQVFTALLPYAKSSEIPNYNLFTDGIVCPSCGSGTVEKHGMRANSTRKIQRYRCRSCGATHSATAKTLSADGI